MDQTWTFNKSQKKKKKKKKKNKKIKKVKMPVGGPGENYGSHGIHESDR